jgi:nitrate/nitrite transporter NarK
MGFAGLAGAGIPWIVETIPSVGIGMALGVLAFGGAFTGFFVPLMTQKWPGPTGTMIFFCFWCWAGIFLLDYAIIETKGKQADEIEQEYLNFKYRPFRLCPRKVLG